MNRRSYLKSSLMVGGSLLLPPGVLALAGCSGTSRDVELASIDGLIMGTSYSIRLGAQPGDELAVQIRAVLDDVDTHMSTWRDDSELVQFNRSGDTDWQPVSASTAEVVAQGLKTSAQSDGAFDATVGPLVDLWGFGASSTSSAGAGQPRNAAISDVQARVGHDAIEIKTDVAGGASAIRKYRSDVQLDLSGIAKGHAVDRLATLLDEKGFDSYLVEVGGELRSRGRKPDGSHWRVAIERPEVGRRGVFKVLDLENRAIATSGDYRNFFDDGGQRFSHSIDPRTGRPVDHDLASVSVVADSTMAADALSTSLMILGPDDAMAFAENHNVAAHLILKKGTSLAEVQSSAFTALAG